MFNISKKLMKKLETVCVNDGYTGVKVKGECFAQGCFGDPPGCYGCSSECVSSCEGMCRVSCKGDCQTSCEGEVR